MGRMAQLAAERVAGVWTGLLQCLRLRVPKAEGKPLSIPGQGEPQGQILAQLRQEAPEAGAQAAALYRLGACPLWYGGRVQWFSQGEACFRAMVQDLRRAQKSIWLEYDQVRPGVLWDTIFSLLRQKAAAGVEVRLLCAGIKARQLRGTRIHACPLGRSAGTARRLLIDGQLCYTGAMGLSDEYIGLRQSRGHWKAGSLRLEGAGVFSYTALFLSSWAALCGEILTAPPRPVYQEGSYCYVQPFWDRPGLVGRSAILGLLHKAEERLWLLWPQPLRDGAVLEALCLAASAGLEVRVILPRGKPSTAEDRLVKAGVQLYAYLPGRLRSALCCADGTAALVAAGKLDNPRLEKQLCQGVWLYGHSAAASLEADFLETLAHCHPF